MGGGMRARQRRARATNRRLRAGAQASGRRGASRLPGRNPINIRRARNLSNQANSLLNRARGLRQPR